MKNGWSALAILAAVGALFTVAFACASDDDDNDDNDDVDDGPPSIPHPYGNTTNCLAAGDCHAGAHDGAYDGAEIPAKCFECHAS
jgi:hypothetical protein